MSKYLNGYSYPIFRIYDGTNFIEEISLPLTNSKGLIEDYTEYSLEHEFLNYSETKKIFGYKINFNLNYDEWVSKDTAKKIINLLIHEYNGRKIILIPRQDVPSRYYEVIGKNKSLQIGIMKGGINANGHKGFNLNFVTKNIVELNYIDPDNIVILNIDYENLIII